MPVIIRKGIYIHFPARTHGKRFGEGTVHDKEVIDVWIRYEKVDNNNKIATELLLYSVFLLKTEQVDGFSKYFL